MKLFEKLDFQNIEIDFLQIYLLISNIKPWISNYSKNTFGTILKYNYFYKNQLSLKIFKLLNNRPENYI